MKAPRDEEEGGIIAQGYYDVNGIFVETGCRCALCAHFPPLCHQTSNTEQSVVKENHIGACGIPAIRCDCVPRMNPDHDGERQPSLYGARRKTQCESMPFHWLDRLARKDVYESQFLPE